MYIPRKSWQLDINLGALDARIMEQPIVSSVTEADFYKFAMGQFLHDNSEFGSRHVTWAFKNRTKSVRLADTVKEEEFMEQWAHVTNMRLCGRERRILGGTYEYGSNMFSDSYLDRLANLQVPQASFSVTNDGQPDIKVEGEWFHSMHAEIPVMKIVNALHYRTLLKDMSRLERHAIYGEGLKRLSETVHLFKKNPHVNFSEFGNRRAFAPAWHEVVVGFLFEELPPSQFIGTSNVHLANLHGTESKGTVAHELSMCLTALMFDGTKESIAKAIVQLHELWWKQYGAGLSIRLPDTYGTPFTMSVLPDSHFRDWKGSRIDSADPFVGVEWEIAKYESLGIDPRGKLAIPSDGLKPQLMVDIASKFENRIKVSFGQGTFLTNNFGLPTLSIVCKPVMIDGIWTVKLSDNLEKRTGNSITADQYMAALGYHAQNHRKQEV